MARQRAAGSIFILALWTLFFLGALALAVGALVSANINQAAQLQARETARQLARAGVERAIHEVVQHPTNWNAKVWQRVEKKEADPPENRELFRNNDRLAGGDFSVLYTYRPEDGEQVVTNYGVLCASEKVDINSEHHRQMRDEFVQRLGFSEEWADEVAQSIYWARRPGNQPGKGRLTRGGGSNYGNESGGDYKCHNDRYYVLHELLLVGVFRDNPGLFAQLQPHLTVYGEESFSGTAVGRALAQEAFGGRDERTVLAESRIDFVFTTSGKIQYWHEY